MSAKQLIPFLSLLYFSSSFGLTLSGFTAFDTVIDLNARSSGVITKMVSPGQLVKQGDVLVELDSTPHKARLDRSQAIEKSLTPVFETAQLELTRAQELYDRDSLSQIELKNTQYRLAVAEGNLQAATADVRLAQYQLDNTLIRSPVDGRVTQLNTNVARYVDPSVDLSPLLSVVKSHRMKVIALLNSDQWSPALLNKPAVIKYREHKFKGVVSFLGYKRIKQASGLPAYELFVSFDTELAIPNEMPVTVEIRD
jgi:RND family efflux transporter MFP subunit